MTRRDAAWAILRAGAVAGAPEFFTAWLAAGQTHAHNAGSAAPPEPDRWTNYHPQFFSQEEMETLDAYTAILIPTDDTPGAREAHVVPFIDFVVNAAAGYEPDLQQQWRAAMRSLRQHNFAALSPARQVAFIEAAAHPGNDGHASYQLIKEMSVHAFYTSRIGLIDVLEYKGMAYLTQFPGCTHPEHHQV